MKKLRKGIKTVKWWQIEDTDFCFFEVYRGRKCIFGGIGSINGIKKFLEDNNEKA